MHVGWKRGGIICVGVCVYVRACDRVCVPVRVGARARVCVIVVVFIF